MQSNAMRAKRM